MAQKPGSNSDYIFTGWCVRHTRGWKLTGVRNILVKIAVSCRIMIQNNHSDLFYDKLT